MFKQVKSKKQTNKTDLPVAVRLRTESERCQDGLSGKALSCWDALRERYSCSMYSGYWSRTLTEAFLRAMPAPLPTRCPPWALTVDTTRDAVHRRTVHRSRVAPIFSWWHSVHREEGQREISFSFRPPVAEKML